MEIYGPNGYGVVLGVRNKLEGHSLMSIFRKLFYKIYKYMSYLDVPINSGAFGLTDKKVVLAIKTLPEKYRFFRGLKIWVGFKVTSIKYSRRERKRGKSSYNFFQYVKHAERGVFGFSYLILDLMIHIGFILVFFLFYL